MVSHDWLIYIIYWYQYILLLPISRGDNLSMFYLNIVICNANARYLSHALIYECSFSSAFAILSGRLSEIIDFSLYAIILSFAFIWIKSMKKNNWKIIK